MDQETRINVEMDRGARADALLRDELLQEAFATLKKEYTDAWLRTSLKETDGRERLWQAMQLLGLIEGHIKRVARDGRVASQDLANVKAIKRV